MADNEDAENLIPTESLNPLGQYFERQFFRAWTLFEASEFEKANTIAKELVNDVLVGELHKAGCHLILAHSPDDYLQHAEQAVKLFKGMYDGVEAEEPTETQKRSQDELVAMAERALETARADAQMYAPSSMSTQERRGSQQSKPERLDTQSLRSILEQRRAGDK